MQKDYQNAEFAEISHLTGSKTVVGAKQIRKALNAGTAKPPCSPISRISFRS